MQGSCGDRGVASIAAGDGEPISRRSSESSGSESDAADRIASRTQGSESSASDSDDESGADERTCLERGATLIPPRKLRFAPEENIVHDDDRRRIPTNPKTLATPN